MSPLNLADWQLFSECHELCFINVKLQLIVKHPVSYGGYTVLNLLYEINYKPGICFPLELWVVRKEMEQQG